jgi:hypothetical protein
MQVGDNIKMDLKEVWWEGVDSAGSGQRSVAGYTKQ